VKIVFQTPDLIDKLLYLIADVVLFLVADRIELLLALVKFVREVQELKLQVFKRFECVLVGSAPVDFYSRYGLNVGDEKIFRKLIDRMTSHCLQVVAFNAADS